MMPGNFHLLLLLGTAAWFAHFIAADKMIINEDDLVDTCTRDCDDIPTVNNKYGCSKITNCAKSSTGWNRGFVRCDFCKCDCTRINPQKKARVTVVRRTFKEPDLFGTCTGTCNRGGIQRTNYDGCTEVRNCNLDKTGWTRGFVRCDYCSCECVKTTYAERYRLTNLRYDLTASTEMASPLDGTLAATTVYNYGYKLPQTASRQLSFIKSTSTQVSSTASLETGLTVTMTAGVTVGVASISSSVAASITAGFTHTSGTTNTTTNQDTITGTVTVPPRTSITMVVVGSKVKANIPYTGTLETEYEDGTKSTKQVSGVYTNVHLAQFRVNYEAAVPVKDT